MDLKSFARQHPKLHKLDPAALVAATEALALKAARVLGTKAHEDAFNFENLVDSERRGSNIPPAKVANLYQFQFPAACRFRI